MDDGPVAFADPEVRHAIERLLSAGTGGPRRIIGLTDLADRSSHPAALVHVEGASVFAKRLSGPRAAEEARAEREGLDLIAARSGVRVPEPVGDGLVALPDGDRLVVIHALEERVPQQRRPADWVEIGRVLARLHSCHADAYGHDSDGFFGPLPQDNAPIPGATWATFYGQRRVLPRLRTAVDAGSVPLVTARRVERLVDRLPALCGPEPPPSLLHGDAQHHNFVSTDGGAVVIDASPYYGHPELDLALLDYFTPVPEVTWRAYEEIHVIDPGFAQRRELWRVFAYLAVLTVDATSPFGRAFGPRLDAALARYL